jgi:hypothetical protein
MSFFFLATDKSASGSCFGFLIRGGPIFLMSDGRWWMITREMPSNSPAVPPLPVQQIFNPMDIRNTTRLPM